MWREQMEKLLELVQIGVHFINQDGITLFYNQKMADIDGLNQEDVLGKSIFHVFPSLTEDSSTLVRALKSGKEVKEHVQTYVNFKGKQITSINNTYPVHHQGQLIGAVELAEDITRIVQLNEQILQLRQQLILDRNSQKKKPKGLYHFSDLIGIHPDFLHAIDQARRTARTDSTLLITGATGTGKEMVAQSIHQESRRKNYPFIAQNCAAVPKDLLEGLLFGTVRGAFTGAIHRPGLFEQAHKGTLFLDEINSLDLELQAKLLRVLQDKNIRRIGGLEEIQTDVRIIAAMNTDPQASIKEGKLRPDFYFRLNVVNIHLPSLMNRKEDIPLLVSHFIEEFNHDFGLSISGASPPALEILSSYPWPGNIRELRHAVEYAYNMVEEKESWIHPNHLPPHIEKKISPLRIHSLEPPSPLYPLNLPILLEEVEGEIVSRTLAHFHHNISRTAEALGIKRQALQYKIKKYGL